VTAPASCGPFRDELPEVALGVLDPSEVPGLAAHLDGCPACRTELVELAATADRLVVAVPEVDPPRDLAPAVVASLRVGRSPGARPRRVAVAVAAVVAVVALAGAVALSVAVDRGSPPGASTAVAASAPLLTADGRAVGRVAVHDDAPPSMTVWLDAVAPGTRYRCELVLADGTRREVGAWTAGGAADSWRVAVPDVRAERVELTTYAGTPVATAALTG
jgi:hypothetical protein